MALLMRPLEKYRDAEFCHREMKFVRKFPTPVRRILAGGGEYYCPVCESHVARFHPYRFRNEAWCPVCTAMERHRLIWLFIERKTDLLDGRARRMLHIAPEPALEPRFRTIRNLDRLTADFLDPRVMVKMDISDIQYPDYSFDFVYCSHVLEHVTDDQKAMRELARVLKPDGWALIVVPITAPQIDEDPTITDPAERLQRFGQEDHVRRYGLDVEQRLKANHFAVEVVRPADVAEPDLRRRAVLPDKDIIFRCRKAQAASAQAGEAPLPPATM